MSFSNRTLDVEGNPLLLLDVLKEGTMFSFSVLVMPKTTHSLTHGQFRRAVVVDGDMDGVGGRENIAFTRNQQVVDKH